jgi:hypothetical protein
MKYLGYLYNKNMKKLLFLILLSPLIYSDDTLIPLNAYVFEEDMEASWDKKQKISDEQIAYIATRCIGLQIAGYSIAQPPVSFKTMQEFIAINLTASMRLITAIEFTDEYLDNNLKFRDADAWKKKYIEDPAFKFAEYYINYLKQVSREDEDVLDTQMKLLLDDHVICKKLDFYQNSYIDEKTYKRKNINLD